MSLKSIRDSIIRRFAPETIEPEETFAPDAGLNKYYCEPDEPAPKPAEDFTEAKKSHSLLHNKL